MRGILLLIPFFLIRFGLLSRVNKEAVRRAAYFAPLRGKEIVAYWVYQISNVAVFLYLCFLKVIVEGTVRFYVGVFLYLMGLALCAISIINFAAPSQEGLNQSGIYRFSRNPMYVSYFIYFAGCCLLTRSWVLTGIVAVFQISSHWIIISEERWCIERFGETYKTYMKRVRRYM